MENRIQAFKEEVKELCKKYDFVIGHEDSHGGFVLKNSYDENCMQWFMNAMTEDEIPWDVFKNKCAVTKRDG